MRVIATTLVKHNGNYYQVGQEIPGLTEVEAAKLLAANSCRVEEGKVAPEKPVDAMSLPADKTIETKETDEVANLPISMKLTKEKLIGIARANGLPVEKTTTRPEAYTMIKEYRAANGIVVEDKEPEDKPKAKNPEAPKKEDVEAAESDTKENAPSGVDSSEDLKNQDGEKVEGDAEVPTAKVDEDKEPEAK